MVSIGECIFYTTIALTRVSEASIRYDPSHIENIDPEVSGQRPCLPVVIAPPSSQRHSLSCSLRQYIICITPNCFPGLFVICFAHAIPASVTFSPRYAVIRHCQAPATSARASAYNSLLCPCRPSHKIAAPGLMRYRDYSGVRRKRK